MALHPNFPSDPHAILDPAIRWFPADEALRTTSFEKLLPPFVPTLRKEVQAWRDKGFQLLAVSVDRSQAELRAYDAILGRMVTPAQRFPWLWRGDPAHRDNFGPIAHTPTSFLLNRAGRTMKVFRGRIEPALWDDIAELVLT